MDEGARALLDALVERFVGVFDESTAAARRAEIEEAGRDALHFGFALAPAEAGEPRDAFYARVQGPRTLIEIDNTSDGDHVHAVWHDVHGDFGDDLLAAHWRRDHGIVIGQR